jgi:hypothetical protein
MATGSPSPDSFANWCVLTFSMSAIAPRSAHRVLAGCENAPPLDHARTTTFVSVLTWGSKVSLAEVAYLIQERHYIGDWELAIKNLDPPNDDEGLHKITHPLGCK